MEEGKKKIRIPDIIVLLIVIAGVLFVGYKVAKGNATNQLDYEIVNSEEGQFAVTFRANEVMEDLVDQIEIGAEVSTGNSIIVMGEVTDVQTEDALQMTANGDAVAYPGYKNVVVSGLVSGTENTFGVELADGSIYSIGDVYFYRMGKVRLEMTLVDIEAVEPAE